MSRFVLSITIGHLLAAVLLLAAFTGSPSDEALRVLLWHAYLFCWFVERYGPGELVAGASLCLLGMLLGVPIYSFMAYMLLELLAKARRSLKQAA